MLTKSLLTCQLEFFAPSVSGLANRAPVDVSGPFCRLSGQWRTNQNPLKEAEGKYSSKQGILTLTARETLGICEKVEAR